MSLLLFNPKQSGTTVILASNHPTLLLMFKTFLRLYYGWLPSLVVYTSEFVDRPCLLSLIPESIFSSASHSMCTNFVGDSLCAAFGAYNVWLLSTTHICCIWLDVKLLSVTNAMKGNSWGHEYNNNTQRKHCINLLSL